MVREQHFRSWLGDKNTVVNGLLTCLLLFTLCSTQLVSSVPQVSIKSKLSFFTSWSSVLGVS